MSLTIKSLFLRSSETFFIRLVGIFFNYLYFYLISHKFTSEGMGMFAFYQSMLLIFSIFPQFGFNTSIIKFISESKNDFSILKKVVFKSLFIVTIFSIITIIGVYLFDDISIFFKNGISFSFYIIISILPFVIINILPEVFRSLNKIRAFILYKYTLLPIFGGFFLVISNYSISPIISYILSIYTIFLLLLIHSAYCIYFKNEHSNTNTETQLSYEYILKTSYPMLLSGSSLLLMSWIDSFMIGIISNNISDVGVYNIAVRISTVGAIILFSINSIAAPKFSQLYANNKFQELKIAINNATKLIFLFTIPILIVLIIMPKFLLGLFGSDFPRGYIVLIILCIGQFFNAFCGSVGYIMQLTGNENKFKKIVMNALFVNIFLNFFLIPKYGINGAAISSIISLILWNFLSMIYIKKKLNISTYFKIVNESKL